MHAQITTPPNQESEGTTTRRFQVLAQCRSSTALSGLQLLKAKVREIRSTGRCSAGYRVGFSQLKNLPSE